MTLYRFDPLPERLVALLRAAHDDGLSDLEVQHEPPALVILHADGAELSETERLEVQALLAADAAELF